MYTPPSLVTANLKACGPIAPVNSAKKMRRRSVRRPKRAALISSRSYRKLNFGMSLLESNCAAILTELFGYLLDLQLSTRGECTVTHTASGSRLALASSRCMRTHT